jgi:hypothetical protein
MGAALGGMLTTVVAWWALLVVLFGVGALALRLAGRRVMGAESAFTAFWFGWASTVALMQLWHLLAPVGPASFAAIAALGLCGLMISRDALVGGVSFVRLRFEENPRQTLLLAGAMTLALLWLANRALAPITPQGDAGLYHVGTIRWIQSHAIVPGLAHLDGRYGFNSSSFLFLAMLDLLPGPPHFYHLGTPVLVIAFSAQTWMYLAQVVRERASVEGHRLLGCLWLGALVPYYFNEWASTSTDTPGLLLGLLVGIHSFRIVFQKLSTADLGFETFVVIFYTAIGMTTKLSFAFLGVGASAVAVYCFVERVREEGGRGTLQALRPHGVRAGLTALVCLLVLVPWLARGVILTGYVAYPSSTALALDVDWRVSEERVVRESDKIKVWAREPELTRRSPDEVLESWDWLGPWLRRTVLRADLFTYPLLLFVGGGAVWLRRRDGRPGEVRSALRYLMPPLVACVLWFVTAPAERFGGAIFWLLGAGMLTILFEQARETESRRRLTGASIGLVAISSLAIFVASAAFSYSRYGWALFVPPGPEAGFHPIPEVKTRSWTSPFGVTIQRPTELVARSSQWKPKAFCWDAEQPCSFGGQVEKRIAYRQPGRIASGFRIGRPEESPASDGERGAQ